jgi:hypothetical protein
MLQSKLTWLQPLLDIPKPLFKKEKHVFLKNIHLIQDHIQYYFHALEDPS